MKKSTKAAWKKKTIYEDKLHELNRKHGDLTHNISHNEIKEAINENALACTYRSETVADQLIIFL